VLLKEITLIKVEIVSQEQISIIDQNCYMIAGVIFQVEPRSLPIDSGLTYKILLKHEKKSAYLTPPPVTQKEALYH